jgi:hypothetical protein
MKKDFWIMVFVTALICSFCIFMSGYYLGKVGFDKKENVRYSFSQFDFCIDFCGGYFDNSAWLYLGHKNADHTWFNAELTRKYECGKGEVKKE